MPHRSTRFSVGFAILSATLMATGGRVRAHGTAPVALSVFAGESESEGVVVATNFGLLSWMEGGGIRWGCETATIADTSRYVVAPGRPLRIFALSGTFIASSADEGCSWHAIPTGRLPVVDAVPDPASEALIILTGADLSAFHQERSAIWTTRDAPPGATPRILYRSNSIELLTVVATPGQQTIYAGGSTLGTHAPALVRSRDGGITWEPLTPDTPLEVGVFNVVYADPRRPLNLLVRASGAREDQLFRSRDGGETLEAVADVRGRVRRVGRRPDGQLAILTLRDGGQDLYLGPFQGPFQTVDLPYPLRDFAIHGNRVVGLVDGDSVTISLATADEGLDAWSLHHDVGLDAKLASCHLDSAECLEGCQTMASFGFLRETACVEQAVVPMPEAPSRAETNPTSRGGACSIGMQNPADRSALILLVAGAWALRIRRVRAD